MVVRRNETVEAQRKILPTETEMGRAAAQDVAALLRELTAEQGRPVLVNFAAAPSQDAFLDALCGEEGIDWSRVQAIHLDEYFDLPREHPNTFETYLRDHIFGRAPIPRQNVHYIKAVKAETPEELANAYAAAVGELLASVRDAGGPYVACIGIGVNGHIGFNEPHVDARTGRFFLPVELGALSVQQQYDDYRNHPNPAARYASMEDVPRRAVTMSCAGILAADRIFCIVPGRQKAQAVAHMWDGPVTNIVPASLLRLHPRMTLYLDAASATLLDRRPELE